MKKKLYIQPNTDFVRMANGEVVMAPIGEGLSGSGTAGSPAPARMGGNAGPAKNLDIRYI